MSWWLWAVFGLSLLIFEAITPGGPFILFFGFGALIVSGLAALGIAQAAWLQWALFSLASILCLVALRKPLRARLNLDEPGRAVDSLVGTEAVLLEDLPPGAVGKAELRGSSWNARSNSGAALPKGTRCRVERVEGLTLWLVGE
jgi:membrane protein implicated in regulation of membrane protease activity